MASSQFFKYEPVKGEDGILNVMRHNKRSDEHVYQRNPHIEASKSHLNYTLHDDRSPSEFAEHVRVQIAKANAKVRKNCVMGIEAIFSLPANWHDKDSLPFFIDCYEWVKSIFNIEMLSFDVHLDEPNPHAHCVFLPLLDNKMQGSKIMGDRALIKLRQSLFGQAVAQKYGLQRIAPEKLTTDTKQQLANQVRNKLKNDAVVNSVVWSVIRDHISKDPLPYAQMLSIPITENTPKAKPKSFIDHKRSKGKGAFIK